VVTAKGPPHAKLLNSRNGTGSGRIATATLRAKHLRRKSAITHQMEGVHWHFTPARLLMDLHRTACR
jgi:hypothetical protein